MFYIVYEKQLTNFFVDKQFPVDIEVVLEKHDSLDEDARHSLTRLDFLLPSYHVVIKTLCRLRAPTASLALTIVIKVHLRVKKGAVGFFP